MAATLESLEVQVGTAIAKIDDLVVLARESNGRQRKNSEAIILISERQGVVVEQAKDNEENIATNKVHIEKVEKASGRWDKIISAIGVVWTSVTAIWLGRQ